MSDDLRDKFESNDDYEKFRKSYDDFKNKTGMFDAQKEVDNYIKRVIRIEELMYKNFILEKKKYFILPDDLFGVKNMGLYIFYFEKMSAMEYNETSMLFLN